MAQFSKLGLTPHKPYPKPIIPLVTIPITSSTPLEHLGQRYGHKSRSTARVDLIRRVVLQLAVFLHYLQIRGKAEPNRRVYPLSISTPLET